MLAAVAVLAGLASSASAQGFAVAGATGNEFSNGVGFGGVGYNNFATSNFGSNNGFVGYNNYSAFNNGYNTGPWFYPGTYTARTYTQTNNNMFGLMNSIQTQTGAGNSYRYGYGPAVGGRRR